MKALNLTDMSLSIAPRRQFFHEVNRLREAVQREFDRIRPVAFFGDVRAASLDL